MVLRSLSPMWSTSSQPQAPSCWTHSQAKQRPAKLFKDRRAGARGRWKKGGEGQPQQRELSLGVVQVMCPARPEYRHQYRPGLLDACLLALAVADCGTATGGLGVRARKARNEREKGDQLAYAGSLIASLFGFRSLHIKTSRIPYPTTTRGRQLLSTIRAISSRFPAREKGEEVPSKSPGLRSARGLQAPPVYVYVWGVCVPCPILHQ